MCRRRSRCQCHLGGVSKDRGSPWEHGDEDRRSESTQEDCWMKQARYRYVSHTLLCPRPFPPMRLRKGGGGAQRKDTALASTDSGM